MRHILKKKYIISLLLVVAIILLGLVMRNSESISSKINVQNSKFPNFKTDFSKSSIDLDKLLSGGPGKDGIPAINNPKFVSLSEADFEDDVLGIIVDFEGEKRYYPYNILVWHEIVNDNIGDNSFAVTFCPLCGSAIVFDRNIKGEILTFGVSGLLFESNLVMYDDKTESLWPQVKREAVVGDFLGTKLEVLPMQVLSFKELKNKYPDAKILSTNTGYSRNYSLNPYGNYNETDDIYFPVSISDKRLPAKEIMYVIPFEEKSIAFAQNNFKSGQKKEFEVEGKKITIEKRGEEIFVISNGEQLPGYFEMWFSWATHHQEDGIVIEI